MKIQAPLVHLNGTSKQELTEQLMKAHNRGLYFKAAIEQMYPNMRDYYPLGDEAFKRAVHQSMDMIANLAGIMSVIEHIFLAIEDGVTEVEVKTGLIPFGGSNESVAGG